MSEAVRLSALRKSQEVILELEDNQEVRYFIKEYCGDQREAYLSRVNKRFQKDSEGKIVDIKDFTGMYSVLLSVTLYDADGKLVPEKTIQAWPDSTQEALFKIAQDICGMNKEDNEDGEDPEKNS